MQADRWWSNWAELDPIAIQLQKIQLQFNCRIHWHSPEALTPATACMWAYPAPFRGVNSESHQNQVQNECLVHSKMLLGPHLNHAWTDLNTLLQTSSEWLSVPPIWSDAHDDTAVVPVHALEVDQQKPRWFKAQLPFLECSCWVCNRASDVPANARAITALACTTSCCVCVLVRVRSPERLLMHCVSASIKVLGGVAKWRHRVLLLRLCVATVILPENKSPDWPLADWPYKCVQHKQLNKYNLILYKRKPLFPSFLSFASSQMSGLVAVTICHLHDFWLLLLLLLLLTCCAVPSMLGSAWKQRILCCEPLVTCPEEGKVYELPN